MSEPGVGNEQQAATRPEDPPPPSVAPQPTPSPEAPEAADPEPPPPAYRSWLSWFSLFWLLDLALLGWLAHGGLPAVTGSALKSALRHYLIKVGPPAILAGILTFALPLAVVDESSRSESRWWLAWLWPLVWIGMTVTDLLVIGYAVLPLIKLVKHH